MVLKRIGTLLLTIILTVSMSGCENLFHTETATQKQGKEVKVSKEKVTDSKKLDEQKKLEMDRKRQEALQQEIRAYLASNNLSGNFSVIQNNRILFREGAGYANIEKKVLNQPSTTYPIGSITKIFVSTSIMMLQEQHKLNIQDPISKYIPDFPNGNQIKLYHFLTHTSGIDKLHWKSGLSTPKKLVSEIEKFPLKFQPGTKWDYLDANYMVLGYVVEQVTGGSLHDFIQKNIIDKVPMKETGFITHEHPLPYTSVSYNTKENNKVEMTQFLSPYSLYGCGDIYSTPYDLAQFDYALLGGKLVSKESIDQMLTPSEASKKYGLGIYYDGNSAWSIGVLGGWYTLHSIYRDNTSIVVFLNARNKTTDIGTISNTLYQMVKTSANSPETVAKTANKN